jgi:hypothetical protein
MREVAGGALRADEAGPDGAPMIGPIRHVHKAISATQRNSMMHLASISRQLARRTALCRQLTLAAWQIPQKTRVSMGQQADEVMPRVYGRITLVFTLVNIGRE